MALIKCPHCGHAVADVSYKCPNCGAPLRKVGDTDIFGDWNTEDKGLEGRRASSKKRRAKAKKTSDDTLVGADAQQYSEDQLEQMREDAKVRAQHESAMKTDQFAQGYGASAGYEYGHDMDATRRYGLDENGKPYYDDSYYKAAYDRDLDQEDQEEEEEREDDRDNNKKQKRSKKTVKVKNKTKTKKQKGRGPLIAIIIILIILLLAGSAFAYYELKWKPDHAQTTEQSVTDGSQSDSSGSSSSDSSGSSSSNSQNSTNNDQEVDNGNGTDSNNSDSTNTDQNSTDQGGDEDSGASGGQDVTDDSGQ